MKTSDFGSRLCEALRAANMSAATLARKTGVSEGVISQYKKGLYKPKQDRLLSIAKELLVSPQWLDGYDAPMHVNHISEYASFSTTSVETAEKIGILRINNNLEIDEASALIGESPSTLIRWEHGDGIDDLTVTQLGAMARAYHTTTSYLMGFIADPAINADKSYYKEPYSNAIVFSVFSEIKPAFNSFEYQSPVAFCCSDVAPPDNYLFAIVRDNSMDPYLKQGEYTCVHKDFLADRVAESGDIVLLVTQDGYLMRQMIVANSQIIFRALNPAYYEVLSIKNTVNGYLQGIHIFGKVVSAMTPHREINCSSIG